MSMLELLKNRNKFKIENIILALCGVLFFLCGIVIKNNRSANQLGIDNKANTNDINATPWVFCMSLMNSFDPTQAYGDGSKISGNIEFTNNLASYNQSRLQAACQMLQQFCTSEYITNLRHFFAKDATKNTTGDAQYIGNCDSISLYLGIALIVLGSASLILAACHFFRPRQSASLFSNANVQNLEEAMSAPAITPP